MLEKLKHYLMLVLGPLLFAAGYIFYLLTKNDELVGELEKRDRDETLKVRDALVEKAKADADSAVADFRAADAEYRKGTDV